MDQQMMKSESDHKKIVLGHLSSADQLDAVTVVRHKDPHADSSGGQGTAAAHTSTNTLSPGSLSEIPVPLVDLRGGLPVANVTNVGNVTMHHVSQKDLLREKQEEERKAKEEAAALKRKGNTFFFFNRLVFLFLWSSLRFFFYFFIKSSRFIKKSC